MKLRAYQWGFNTMRKNSYRKYQTPFEIIKNEADDFYATLSKELLVFPSCTLDEKFATFIKGGYHVALPTYRELKKISFTLYFTIFLQPRYLSVDFFNAYENF